MTELPLQELPQFDLPEVPPQRNSRMANFARHPLGKITAGVAAVLAMTGGPDSGNKDFSLAVNDYRAPYVEVLTNQTHLTFEDWQNTQAFDVIPAGDPLEPNPFVQQLATTNEDISNELTHVENPPQFSEWVTGQAMRTDLLEAAGIKDPQTATPKQLVNLSAYIVIANVDYYYASTEDIQEHYNQPMDQNLMDGEDLQCEGYAAATLIVFNEMKKQHPQVLQNTYMATQSGIQEGHVWDLVIQLQDTQSPDGLPEASLSFIDPAGDDPTYEDGTKIQLNFIQLVEGLQQKGIIDNEMFHHLTDEYAKQTPLTDNDREQLQQDKLYTGRFGDNSPS